MEEPKLNYQPRLQGWAWMGNVLGDFWGWGITVPNTYGDGEDEDGNPTPPPPLEVFVLASPSELESGEEERPWGALALVEGEYTWGRGEVEYIRADKPEDVFRVLDEWLIDGDHTFMHRARNWVCTP